MINWTYIRCKPVHLCSCSITYYAADATMHKSCKYMSYHGMVVLYPLPWAALSIWVTADLLEFSTVCITYLEWCKNQKHPVKTGKQIIQSFSSLQLSGFHEPVPMIALDSCFWLRKVEPGVVFYCWSPFISRFKVLSFLFTLFVMIIWVTIHFLASQTSLSIFLWPLLSCSVFLFCFVFATVLCRLFLV